MLKTSVVGNKGKGDLDVLLEDMEDSMTVVFSYHADNPSVGLSLHKDKDAYKMFLSDTGLFITLAFWDKSVTENVIYQKLLSDMNRCQIDFLFIQKI